MENGERKLIVAVTFPIAIAVLLLMLSALSVGAQEPSIIVSPTTLTVSEPNGSDTFKISLATQPTADVTIDLSTSNGRCGTSTTSVVLTDVNWNTGIDVTVSAVDDLIANGTQTCTVQTSRSSSADNGYNNLPVEDVSVSVSDNDVAGVTVNPTLFTIGEPAGSRSVSFQLTSQPAANVTINLSTSNTECSVSVPSVSLTPANWSIGVNVTVAAVDDDIDDGDRTCIVQTTAASTDLTYNGIAVADITATVQDDDTAGITVIPTSLTVSEPAGSKKFAVRLNSQPIASVLINLSASNTQCSISTGSATLTSANWNAGVNVTVTAVDDLVRDGAQLCPVVTAPAISTDPKYNNINPPDVSVTVNDDETAGVNISPTTVDVAEGGTTDSYLMSLSSSPAATVNLSIATDGQTTVNPTQVVFNQSNWDQPRTIVVTAVDDKIAEGSHTSLIEHTTSSTDPNYNNLTPPSVTANIQDNDAPGFDLSPPSLTISEPNGSGVVTITLTSSPKSKVTIPLSTSSTECDFSPSSVVLNNSNWDTGVGVTASATDDDIADGAQLCIVQTGAALSSDQKYNGLNPPDVTITVQDDDVAGITVAPTNLTISEPNESAIFSVSLTSRPKASVTIPLTTSNDECSALPTSVLIAIGDWQVTTPVTVMAVDDDTHDGDQVCVVQTSPAVSTDLKYAGLDPDDVIATVLDDERAWSAYLPVVMRNWPPIPDAPVLQPISNPDNNGSFTVNWTSAPLADSYILQEAKDAVFSNPAVLYEGPNTSFDVAGRGAARYFYRVKGRNSSQESNWSNTRSVDVLWEAEPNDLAPNQTNGPLVSGLNYLGAFPVQGDINDYYYFDLASQRTVELWLRNIAVGQNYDLVLRNSALISVGYSGELDNTDEHIVTQVLPAGRYYVQVYHRSLGTSSQPYTLQVLY